MTSGVANTVLKITRQSGQATLEILLIGVLGLMIWSGITKTMRTSGIFQTIFGDPWARLANVMEFGVPTDKTNSAGIHPAYPARHSTRKKE